MNSCELDLVKMIKTKFSQGDISPDEFVLSIMSGYKETDKTEVEKEITRLLNEDGNTGVKINTPYALDELFMIRGHFRPDLYTQVRNKVKVQITKKIFDSASGVCQTNAMLHATLIGLSKSDVSSAVSKYLRIKSGQLSNADLIANYLVNYHLPTIINTWYKDVITFDETTQKYKWAPKEHNRTDWYDDDDTRDMPISTILEELCTQTSVRKFGKTIETLGNRRLTKYSFYYAVSEVIKDMQLNNKEAYKKFLDNPISIIDYIINSKWGDYKKSADSLAETVIKSFFYQWIYNGYNYSNLFTNSISWGAQGFNPLNIIIAAATKFQSNNYIEYNLVDGDSTLTLAFNQGPVYMQWIDNVTRIAKQKGENFFNIDNKITLEDLQTKTIILFGSDVTITENTKKNFVDAIKFIYEHFSAVNGDNLQEKLKSSKDNPFTKLFPIVNKYNPYIVIGAIKNAADKSLPTIGLASVGSRIKDEIIRNRSYADNQKTVHNQCFGKDSYIKKPYEHTTLFDTDNVIITTEYRSSIQKYDVIKEPNDVSKPEAVKTTFLKDFLPGYRSSEDDTVRIQAITPSDKTRIPLFNIKGWKNTYGTGKSLKQKTQNTIKNMYESALKNSIENIITALTFDGIILKFKSTDLLGKADELNKQLMEQHIDQNRLNKALYEFNTKYENVGINMLISDKLDYTTFKQKGENGEDMPYIQVSPYSISAVKFMRNPSNWQTMLDKFKTELKTYITKEDAKYTNEKDFDQAIEDYFYLKNIIGEEILANTVGLPLAHKTKMKNKSSEELTTDDYLDMDSEAHITMVKRMVALTTTMQPCTRGLLSGMPNKFNMVTVKNETLQMHTYSGNAASGTGASDELTVSDGAMWSCRFTQNLFNQSVADTQPEGIGTKLISHAFNETVGSSHLSKLANFVIDNAILRKFGDPDMELVGATNPYKFVKLSLHRAKLKESSFNEDGKLVDFDGDEVYFNVNYKVDSTIWTISSNDVTYNPQTDKLTAIRRNGAKSEIISVDNNLYKFWEKILGGAYSCDYEGNFNEDSQDTLTMILNSVGEKNKDVTDVKSQNDVNQYLKKKINHYFCSDSAQKSLQCPIVNIRTISDDDLDTMYAIKMNIEHFGIQLNADHSSTDGRIREISQLISFICEKGYCPEKIDNIYSKLAELTLMLADKVIVNEEMMQNPEQWRQRLDEIFGPRIIRALTDPDADVKSLANSMLVEIQKYNRTASKKLNIPYSDAQLVGKFHTTVGSYMNKFISRSWAGRADVLVPSHNMFMVYEDAYGNVYQYDDMYDGNVPIKQHLRDQVWKNFDMRILRDDLPIVDEYEVSLQDVYYDVATKEVKVINTYNDLIEVSNNIRHGAKYVRALDLPRNLRSKRCFVDVNGRRYNLYFFKTMREMMDPITSYERKLELQEHLEQYVLPKLANPTEINDIVIEELEIDTTIQPIQYAKYVSFDSERLTTNYYENNFGIRDMNFSEIAQLKDGYFYSKLKEKFQQPQIDLTNSDIVFYDISGTATLIKLPENEIPKSAFPVDVKLNEDGYRIDNKGNKLYKWPKNARLYIYKVGGLKYEIIKLTNESDIAILDKSGHFVIQRASVKTISSLPNFSINKISEIEENILRRLAKDQYNSWLYTNSAIVARIPSQSLSFGMVMKTVGYLPYKTNITMVPNEHVYIQGSDYDIDKVYAMMVSLNRQGLYKNNHNITVKDVDLDSYSLEWNERFANQIITKEGDIALIIDAWMEDVVFLEDSIVLNEQYIINFVAKQLRWTEDQISAAFSQIHELIQTFQKELSYRESFKAITDDDLDPLQNFILSNIIDIYHDPRTLVAANTPTTMYPVNSVVTQLNLNKDRRNHLDPMTDIHLNQTTSVGRTDIGISAVGQKAFYALTYQHILANQNNENVVNLQIINANVFGANTLISVGFSAGRWNQASIDSLVNIKGFWNKSNYKQIGNYHFYKNENGQLLISTEKFSAKQLKEKFKTSSIKPGDFLSKLTATSINSAIISSSTDNAKEMKMDLLNATPEILPGYEFLVGIGVPMIQAAKIFTDPIVPYLITKIRGDLYTDKKKSSRSQLKALKKLKYDEFKSSTGSDITKEIFNDKIEILKSIFQGALELTIVGRTLGINQGINVELGDPILYELRFERDVNDLVEDKNYKFSYEQFILGDDAYRREWIDRVEKHTKHFNVLKIARNVPHFWAMLKIPLYFKKAVETSSKDVRDAYSMAKHLSGKNYIISTKAIKRIARLLNDRKIYSFLSNLGFEYETSLKWNNGNIDKEEVKRISTSTEEGIILLKHHIEQNIIEKVLKTEYANNRFVQNLIYNSQYDYLFKMKTSIYGSLINVSDSQNSDLVNGIKSEFYLIQNKVIDGHTIYEWMWLYNAICHKNQIGKHALGVFLDNIHSDEIFDENSVWDENHILFKWVQFINQHDVNPLVYTSLSEAYNIGLETYKSYNQYHGENDDLDYDFDFKKPKSILPNGIISPDIFPLFVKIADYSRQILKNSDKLSALLNAAKIIAIKC